MNSVPPVLPKHLPADERRAATVEAVVALAATQNPSDITTTAIAQQMQLTQGALFRHFANKDAILLAVMEWVATQLLARVDQAAHSASAPSGALQAVFMAHVGFVAEHPGVPRIIFSELQRAGETPPKRAVQQLVGSTARACTGCWPKARRRAPCTLIWTCRRRPPCLLAPCKGW